MNTDYRMHDFMIRFVRMRSDAMRCESAVQFYRKRGKPSTTITKCSTSCNHFDITLTQA